MSALQVSDVVLTGVVGLGTVAFPIYLTANDRYKVLFEGLFDWKPLGLCLGLTSVAVSQAVAIAYQGVRFRQRETLQDKEIQKGKSQKYDFWEGAVTHLSQPEGFVVLGGYLTASWMLDAMQSSYYSFEGGICWKTVAAQLLVQDAVQTVLHLIEHRFPWLYKASHKPHHRFLVPRLFDAFNGSLNDTLLMIVLPLFVTQRLVPANVWSYMTFGSILSTMLVLIHSEWTHPWEPLFERLGVGTAADHHVHHAIFNKNFGHLFTYWDRLVGTYANPQVVFGAREKAAEKAAEGSRAGERRHRPDCPAPGRPGRA
eukprot:TRINITY_DN32331_c0_g1_i1.p1 TRINITY_DN32331_c0_g1~~TRINITY_DN32331_c0_g1_i1.p1  ORF type:complete len:313 (+),score=103.78 TRINITY_DN32331_c0_g1_i1:52-990(+)